MLDTVKQSNITVHPAVRNIVILALWGPLVVVLWSAALAVAGLAYHVARTGDVGGLARLAGAVDPTVAVIVGGAVAAYLYLALAIATFGEEVVNDTTETATDVAEEVR